MRHVVVLVGGALAQLAVWVVARPETAASFGEGRVVAWLVLEAALAAVIGVVSADERLAVRSVVLGWLLQVLWYAVTVDKGDGNNLWGVVLVLQAGLAVVATVIARVLARTAARVRSRRRG